MFRDIYNSKTQLNDMNGRLRLIPVGELKCVWMQSGIISYKLCRRNYDCENCPLDKVLKGADDFDFPAANETLPLDQKNGVLHTAAKSSRLC